MARKIEPRYYGCLLRRDIKLPKIVSFVHLGETSDSPYGSIFTANPVKREKYRNHRSAMSFAKQERHISNGVGRFSDSRKETRPSRFIESMALVIAFPHPTTAARTVSVLHRIPFFQTRQDVDPDS